MKTATLPIVLGVAAALSAFPAWWPQSPPRSAAIDYVGKPLGKEVAPEQVADLRVAQWDDATKQAKVFEVKKIAGSWVIPTAFNYPADATSRVGRTAGGVLGVPRGRFVSDDAKFHEELGVIDPLAADAAGKGCGKRITLKDQADGTLIDIIVGKAAADAPGVSYVREVDSAKVYTAKIGVEVSTKFIDWVEPDLLKVSRDAIIEVAIQDYSVDTGTGKLDLRADTHLQHAGAADAPWTSPQTPDDKRVGKDGIDKLINQITGLKLAGIRPFNLNWLMPRGFFVSDQAEMVANPLFGKVTLKQGNYALIGNEGSMSVTTKDGVHYQLFFGSIALGDDQDKEADTTKPDAKDEKPDEAKDPGKEDDKKDSHNRYMVVLTTYDPEADQAAKKGKPAEGTTPAKDEKTTKPAGQEKAEKAQKRFLAYFYVISDASFQALRPAADKLFETKPPEPMAGNTGKTVKQWLEDNGKREGVTTTASGLQYEVLAGGAPEGKSPVDGDTVKVRYKGTLVDGTEFDASKEEPASFGVNSVIPGWTEALKLMRPGDRWKLTIPPEIGYKEAGQQPKIPANAILVFEVELVEVAK